MIGRSTKLVRMTDVRCCAILEAVLHALLRCQLLAIAEKIFKKFPANCQLEPNLLVKTPAENFLTAFLMSASGTVTRVLVVLVKLWLLKHAFAGKKRDRVHVGVRGNLVSRYVVKI